MYCPTSSNPQFMDRHRFGTLHQVTPVLTLFAIVIVGTIILAVDATGQPRGIAHIRQPRQRGPTDSRQRNRQPENGWRTVSQENCVERSIL